MADASEAKDSGEILVSPDKRTDDETVSSEKAHLEESNPMSDKICADASAKYVAEDLESACGSNILTSTLRHKDPLKLGIEMQTEEHVRGESKTKSSSVEWVSSNIESKSQTAVEVPGESVSGAEVIILRESETSNREIAAEKSQTRNEDDDESTGHPKMKPDSDESKAETSKDLEIYPKESESRICSEKVDMNESDKDRSAVVCTVSEPIGKSNISTQDSNLESHLKESRQVKRVSTSSESESNVVEYEGLEKSEIMKLIESSPTEDMFSSLGSEDFHIKYEAFSNVSESVADAENPSEEQESEVKSIKDEVKDAISEENKACGIVSSESESNMEWEDAFHAEKSEAMQLMESSTTEDIYSNESLGSEEIRMQYEFFSNISDNAVEKSDATESMESIPTDDAFSSGSLRSEEVKMEFEVLPIVSNLVIDKENPPEEQQSGSKSIEHEVKDVIAEESNKAYDTVCEESKSADAEKKLELVSTDKSSDDKSSSGCQWKVGKRVGTLVQRFCSLGSSKQKVATPEEHVEGLELLEDSLVNIPPRLKEKKSQTPKKMAVSPGIESKKSGYTSTEDDTESPLFTADEIETSKTSDEELKPSKMCLAIQGAEPPPKRTSIKDMYKKCRVLIGTPKKVSEIEGAKFASATTQTEQVVPVLTEESSTENRPTTLQVHLPSDADSKSTDKKVFKSMSDKTKEFIKGRKSVPVEAINPDVEIPDVVYPLLPDTPCSGAFADVSEMSTVTGSSSSASPEIIFTEDSKSKFELTDTVIEIPKRNLFKSEIFGDPEGEMNKETKENLPTEIKYKTLELSNAIAEDSNLALGKKTQIKNMQVEKLKDQESSIVNEDVVDSSTSPRRDVAQSPPKTKLPDQEERIECGSPENTNKNNAAVKQDIKNKKPADKYSPESALKHPLAVSLPESGDIPGSLRSSSGEVPASLRSSSCESLPFDILTSENSESDVNEGKRPVDFDDNFEGSPSKRSNILRD